MKLQTENKITAGFVFALASLLFVSVVSYIRITGLLKAFELVEHTHLVLENVEHILSAMQDVETGQRGYIITGEERYLEPYRAAVSRIREPLIINDTSKAREFGWSDGAGNKVMSIISVPLRQRQNSEVRIKN